MVFARHTDLSSNDARGAASSTREIDAQGLELFYQNNGENTMVIVLDAVMDLDVDGDALSEAVRQTERRFTSFGCGLATTGRGLRFKPLASAARAYEDVPGKRWLLGTGETDGRLYRVTYAGPHITVSLHHGLADGRGALEYLKTLLFYYLVALGHPVEPEGKVLLLGEVLASEDECPHKKHGKPGVQAEAPAPVAAQLFGIQEDYLDERGEYLCRHVELTAPVASVLTVARGAETTVTPLLVAAVDRAIAQTYHPQDEMMLCCVTTDLRPLFGSTTVQNFASWHILAEVPAMRSLPIEAEARALKQQLDAVHSQDAGLARISERLALAARLEDTPADEMFGNEASRMVEKRGVRSRLAGMVTNVGVIDLPEGVQRHVRQASFRIPSFNATITIAVSTCGDTLTLNITQPFASQGFSCALAEVLVQLGIPADLIDRGLEGYDVLRRDAVADLDS